ncbi:helix-turn-helix domain-containing protein [Paenibacillus sp. SYP-B4298]|uniref:helix-turn-helix domain-containing protein n=1 Tax=Paenibacillus sp. SYP-B4298 TaxID=2996034 RepID=UPI0022DCF69C|nr:helix-turn-helix domain-containing protein [Paenibacillus sp. SYP-B4298]
MRTYLWRLLLFSLVIGTLPVILTGGLSYFIAAEAVEEKVSEGNQLILQQTRLQLEQMLKSLEKSTLQFSNSPLVRQALGQQWTEENFVEVREMTTGLLSLQTSIPVHRAYFANLESQWVVGLDQFKPLPLFQERARFLAYAGDPRSLFVDEGMAENPVTGMGEGGNRSAMEAGADREARTVRLVQKVPLIPRQQVPRGLMVVEVLKQDMESLLSRTKEMGFHYIIGQDGVDFLGTSAQQQRYGKISAEVLARLMGQGNAAVDSANLFVAPGAGYGTATEQAAARLAMGRDSAVATATGAEGQEGKEVYPNGESDAGYERVAVVDERSSSRGAGVFRSTMADGTAVVVAYQSSAYNGWTYISVTSLSEVTKQTKSIAILTAVSGLLILALVLVSAYFGSLRMYLPIRRLLEVVQQLGMESAARRRGELSEIESSLRSLAISRSQLQQQMRGQARHLKEYMVLKLFAGQDKGGQLQQQGGVYGFPLRWGHLAVMTVQLDPLEGTRFGSVDRDLLLFAINNMVGELLPGARRFEPILFDQSQATLLVLDEADPAEAKRAAYAIAEQVKEQVWHYLALGVSIGISRPFPLLAETVRAYEESLSALKSRIRLGYGIIVHYDDAAAGGSPGEVVYAHLKVMEDRMIHYLREQDEAQLEEAFHGYLTEILERETYRREHLALLLQFIARVLQQLRDGGVPLSAVFDGDRQLQQLLALHTRSELQQWFTERLFRPVARQLQAREEKQYDSIAEQMAAMIHDGYHTPLTLELCAQRLNYHPVYLSRVFKKHIGRTFSEYMSDYRMKQAKRLLETTTLKIADIGEQLQFNNTSAFIRSFRKYAGMTPGQYREQRSRLAEDDDME